MPKAKPMLLNPSKRRKAEIEARIQAELSLAPVTPLPDDPPQLKGEPYALECYRRLMTLYSETIAEIVTAFDLDALVEYCLALQEQAELRAMRGAALTMWQDANKRAKRARSEKSALIGEAGYLMERVLALDSRMDAKGSRCHKLRAALYLTPAARAGKAPPLKRPEPESGEMDDLLG